MFMVVCLRFWWFVPKCFNLAHFMWEYGVYKYSYQKYSYRSSCISATVTYYHYLYSIYWKGSTCLTGAFGNWFLSKRGKHLMLPNLRGRLFPLISFPFLILGDIELSSAWQGASVKVFTPFCSVLYHLNFCQTLPRVPWLR